MNNLKPVPIRVSCGVPKPEMRLRRTYVTHGNFAVRMLLCYAVAALWPLQRFNQVMPHTGTLNTSRSLNLMHICPGGCGCTLPGPLPGTLDNVFALSRSISHP